MKNTSSNIFRAACFFSLSVALDIEPFLKLFQSERPLAPFLYEKLKGLCVTILERIVKPDVLLKISKARKLMKLDLENTENLLASDSIDLGIGCKSMLKKLKSADNP